MIIEDEEAIAEFVRLNLERAGFRVAWAASGEDGLGLVRREPPVLVVLDLRLPGMDGLEVCRHLRQFYPEVAVIMLTARGQPLDKVRGLELGADDYITKPFDPRELVARVQAVLRRTRPGSAAQGRVKQFGSLHIDLRRRRVSKGDRILELTPREFDLLAFLGHRPGQVFSRDEILKQVLVNLVDNALKFTPAGGKIIVTLERLGQNVALKVADTGVGIDPQELPLVTQRFYRGRQAPSSGSGLGLALCEEIIGLHGGRLEIASQPGQGTTVTVLLPAR